MSYRVHFPPWAPHLEWERGFELGTSPDRFPYGMHHLSTVLPDVDYGNDLTTSWARLLRRPSRSTLHISWDERSGFNAWVASGRPRWATGVIWATDEVAARVSPIRRAAMRQFLLRCELLWVLSSAQVEPLQKWLGPKAPRIEFLKFGIDTDFFSPGDETLKKWDLIAVGNDSDRDRMLLYRSLEILQQRGLKLRVLVQSPDDEAMPSTATRLERGSALALKELYLQSRIAVISTLPNLHVSGMTVALEAQALGIPVVATYTPGFESYLRHGVDGLLVDSNADALANGIENLLTTNSVTATGRLSQGPGAESNSSKKMMQCLGRMILEGKDSGH